MIYGQYYAGTSQRKSRLKIIAHKDRYRIIKEICERHKREREDGK